VENIAPAGLLPVGHRVSAPGCQPIPSGSGAVTSRVRRRHVTLVDVCIDDGLRAGNHHLFPRL